MLALKKTETGRAAVNLNEKAFVYVAAVCTVPIHCSVLHLLPGRFIYKHFIILFQRYVTI